MIDARTLDAGASHAKEPSPVPVAETSPPLDERPHSLYEAVTRQMLEDLKADVSEVKGRVNTLLWLVAGSVLAEVVLRLVK